MKNSEKFIPNILLLLIVIYFSQDVLYTGGGSIIAQLSLFVILGVSGIYLIKTLLLKTKKPDFYKAWTSLLILNLFGYIFTADHSFSGHFSQFKAILMVLIPFFPFYYFSQKNIIGKRSLIVFFIITLAITVAQFYAQRAQILSSRVTDNEDVVNNVAYTFVFLIPFLFLLKNKKILSMLLAFLLLFFIIQGAKRGAMIAGSLGLIFFGYYQFKTIGKKNKIKGTLLAIVGVVALVYFAYSNMQQNQFLVERLQSMEEGQSSGRDVIYLNLFNTWYNSDSFINILFGHGFGSTIFFSGAGHWAHNDWLELLTNFGLLGVAIYLSLFVSSVKMVFGKQWNIDKRIVLMAILSIWFLTTVVSMNYTSTSSIYQTIMLAVIYGSQNKSIV